MAEPTPSSAPLLPRPAAIGELPEAVIDAVSAALGDAYDCHRVWSAWSYGTMGSDDFGLVAEDGERVAEIARAAIEAYVAATAVHCATCNDQGAVGNILTAEPCPDCSPPRLAARTAPERIWLDLGVEEAEHANFAELSEITWSQNNATGHGVAYVRADTQAVEAQAPAAVAVPDAVDLRAALARLESACDMRAKLTTPEAYKAIAKCDGMMEALEEMDEARRRARAALAATPALPATEDSSAGEQEEVQPSPTSYQVLAITTAYEQGVGKGHDAHNRSVEIENPYSKGYRCDEAWQLGYEEGKKQATRKAEAQAEPAAWMDDGSLRSGATATAHRVVTAATKAGMPRAASESFNTPLYKELQVQPADALPQRTDVEIVEQTETLAKYLLDWKWGQEPEFPDLQMRHSTNHKAQICWKAACEIQELITDTDVENAVSEADAAMVKKEAANG